MRLGQNHSPLFTLTQALFLLAAAGAAIGLEVTGAVQKEIALFGPVTRRVGIEGALIRFTSENNPQEFYSDSTDIDTWAGVAGEPGAPPDRDLWKYDRMVQDLDRRLAKNPRDADALIQRGNAYYFELHGAEKARRHYKTALEIVGEDPVVRSNLDKLGAQARP